MKNILITGAASGLGKALAVKFAENGYHVIVADIQDDAGNSFVNQLHSKGMRAEYFHCDVGDIQDIQSLSNAVSAKYKSLDILINNAGVASAGTLEKTTPDEWKRLLKLDLMSVVYMSQLFLPVLKNSKNGHIVNIASFAGLALLPGMMTYNVAKAAVIAFSETLAGEVHQYGIGVSVACPAFFQTDLVSSMQHSSEATKSFVERQMKNSGVCAQDVAEDIFNAVRKNKFMVLSHKQSRLQYFFKRLFPNWALRTKIKIYNKIKHNL